MSTPGSVVAPLARALLLVAGLALHLPAQDLPSGRIVGRIVDARTGNGIPNAGVQLVGTTQGVQSGLDGRYVLPRVVAGTATVQVRRIGYTAKTVTGLMVPAGGTLEQDIVLDAAVAQLTATVVTVDKERGSVAAALDAQRQATQVVNAITAEQIAKSPDGDAAQAMQRVSGVSVQDGKYVFVRGLGERYTTASLNGARLPSPEPERKVVPLDLFPSGILQSVTTSKTFTPDLQGDFSGAQVDIRTREYPAQRQARIAVSTGVNDAALRAPVLRAPHAGGEYFALVGDARNAPAALTGADFASLNQLGTNRIIRSLSNAWSPRTADALPAGGVSASLGGSDPIFGRTVGYLLSASYGVTQEVLRDQVQSFGIANGAGTVSPISTYRGETGRVSVLWGGIANLSTMLGTTTRLALNTTFSRTADNEARQDVGFDENLADTLRRTTLRYVERGIWSTQLALERQQGDHRLEVAVTASGSSRAEPDRSDMVQFVRQVNGVRRYELLGSALDGARRSYFDLAERNLALQASDQFSIGPAGAGNSLKVGAYARSTMRTSLAPSYSLIATGLPSSQLAQAPESIFTAANACDACTNFALQPIGQAGSYDATDRVLAGFGMVDWGLGARVRVVTGARVEQADVEVRTVTQSGARYVATIRKTDILPALTINAKLGERQVLRASISQTLARPEYRELSPVQFRDVLGGISVSGNEKLERTLIRNADLRWELYPGVDEIVSVGVFWKQFDKPIERVEQPSSGGATARYANAASARNVGVELELRQGLGRLLRALDEFTAFGNVTLMQSTVDVGSVGNGNLSNPNRPMAGQAPYVVNAGLTWDARSGRASATLLYNVVGRRISAAGLVPLPDVYENERHVVDVALRVPLASRLDARLDARNLLDAPTRFTQGTLVREGWRSGRTFTIGLGWRP
ncbi:MAG: TonB-dependent receptor [Gemmatimonadetes bacterium]|nr:TonB-dependent receptor [Gemmatimonadota bacterium]